MFHTVIKQVFDQSERAHGPIYILNWIDVASLLTVSFVNFLTSKREGIVHKDSTIKAGERMNRWLCLFKKQFKLA